MGDRTAKDALYEGLTTVAKALSSGRRAELIDVLAQGERSVDDLAEEIDQSVANTSHHLQALARSGLVSTRRDGTRVYYRLASSEVEDLWEQMRAVASQHVAGVPQLALAYLGDQEVVEGISADDLAERQRAGNVVVLDVRPPAEYEAGHIRGAVSIPLPELSSRLGELGRDVETVAYCRGPYCAYADEAVRLLLEHGFRARRLEDGYPEWRRAGRPTARDDRAAS